MAGGDRIPRRGISWVHRHRRSSKQGARDRENGDLVLKPGKQSCGEWICVHGQRIKLQGRMRVDNNGNVYVPDSEDEEPGMGVEAGSVEAADSGGAAVTGDGIDVAAEGGEVDGVKVVSDAVSGDEMHPKMVERLNMVLAHIDPAFHNILVDMLKVTVPAFFDP
ncbi:unnamed protein product [Urochloa humidicola]